MEWFDCHVEFGRRMVPSPIQLSDAASLATLYAEIGIQRALVIHPALYQQNPVIGNPRILEETKDFPQFTPAWAILPPQTRELGESPSTFCAQMRAAGVRALWAFPSEHRYVLNALTCGPLLEEIAARRIPLFVHLGSLGQPPSCWERLAELTRDFPTLRLVAIPIGIWGDDRYFRSFMEAKLSCWFATSTYMVEGGLKALVDQYGSDRLLFGSGYPDWQPGGGILSLLHSGVSEQDIAAIAGGNLQRLLAEVTL